MVYSAEHYTHHFTTRYSTAWEKMEKEMKKHALASGRLAGCAHSAELIASPYCDRGLLQL
jgi:hypothetical protein